jgi:hypothetical protein
MNMLEIPQGAGSGFVWDNKGHVVRLGEWGWGWGSATAAVLGGRGVRWGRCAPDPVAPTHAPRARPCQVTNYHVIQDASDIQVRGGSPGGGGVGGGRLDRASAPVK